MMNKNSAKPSRQTISMTALRLKTREIIEKVYYTQNIFVVKAYDRPMAAIIGIAQFEKLMALAASAELSDDEGTADQVVMDQEAPNELA
jgi:prevent-host-death family protein